MNPRDLPPIVTSAQMRLIDELAIKKYGIPSLDLMETAGSRVANHIIDNICERSLTGKRIAILCGPGNNGGDGYVVARHLGAAGARVEIFSVVALSKLNGDAKVNADRVAKSGISVWEVEEDAQPVDLSVYHVIVDALFGTGFHGAIDGVAARLIQAANASGVTIIAIDTPSGLGHDRGQYAEPAIRAAHTLTLGAVKLGQLLWPGRKLVGELDIIDIGIPSQTFRELDVKTFLMTSEFVRSTLPARPPEAHKGTFGKVLIIGGSAGLTGAIVLAANASMRSGVGLTYAAVPESLVDVVDAGAIETVTRALPEVGGKRVLARRALGECVRLSDQVDAIAIGPGLSIHHETQVLVRRLIQRLAQPAVIDADGLNACARDTSCLEGERHAQLILTPHVGEMARLLGASNEEIAGDRQTAATEAARRFKAIIVMKGAPTFVADPDGFVYLNPTGNSGMASGGVGDVLTGIIVSLLAQGCQPLDAALLGTYLHGLAGDMAADSVGQRSLVASDLVDALPDAFLHISH